MKKIGFLFIVFCICLNAGYAQQLAPLVKPEVDDSQVMFKKVVQRRMDLLERQNLPFFSKNGEISRLLIEAVDEGLLTPYRSDSCINFMPDIIFVSNISVENEVNPNVGGGFASSGFSSFDDEPTEEDESLNSDEPVLEEIPVELFSVLFLKEDLIFDRNRSRMYNYIRTISLYLPPSAGPDYNPGGFDKPVAHFKYEDVVNLFRGPYADRANYYNSKNQAASMNMSDAFELRLFQAPITKIGNDQDLDIRQIQEYAAKAEKNPLEYIMIQQKYEYDLMEYESELWEY